MRKRESGIDLIKIIMMLWIVMFHMANHSMVDLISSPLSASWIFEAFCKIGGGVADCTFVLITGLLYYNKKIKIVRIMQLWCEVWFYSVTIGVVCIVTGIAKLSVKEIVKMCFPVIYNEYPFFSAYMVLFLLIPFINRLLDTLTMEQVRKLSWLLFMIVSVIPTFTCSSWIMTSTQLPMFITLYVLGFGFGKYGMEFLRFNRLYNGMVLSIMLVLTWMSEILLHIIGISPFYFVWDMNKLPVVIIAIEIIVVFKNVKVEGNIQGFVETVSKSVFGVYLIHIHRTLKTPLLDVLFDNRLTYGTWKIIPQVFAGALLILVSCVIIDWIRIHTLERMINRPLIYVSNRISEMFALDDNINNDNNKEG